MTSKDQRDTTAAAGPDEIRSWVPSGGTTVCLLLRGILRSGVAEAAVAPQTEVAVLSISLWREYVL